MYQKILLGTIRKEIVVFVEILVGTLKLYRHKKPNIKPPHKKYCNWFISENDRLIKKIKLAHNAIKYINLISFSCKSSYRT